MTGGMKPERRECECEHPTTQYWDLSGSEWAMGNCCGKRATSMRYGEHTNLHASHALGTRLP